MDLYWQKVEEAIAAVEEISDENEYRAWLENFCQDDKKLKAEIESLLSLKTDSEKFLNEPVAEYFAKIFAEKDEDLTGTMFGNYQIIKEIGSGGMGEVYLAKRNDGEFNQLVAVKIVRQSFSGSEMLKRFKRERQILASLNHPQIAKLIDGGVSTHGTPYLVMEYIEGVTLNEFVNERKLELKERLRLFLKICRGISFAHRNLVVHRDLKPSNILITSGSDPKILDFGLAKLVDESQADALQTQTAFAAMTPAYASPEQMRGGIITTSTDIYSLGVVLYELLTGEPPFYLAGHSLDETFRMVCEIEPTKPSKAAAQKALKENILQLETDKDRNENANVGLIVSSALKGDLDNIVIKALRKEPERRYGSVEQFAADIENYLDGLPISARPNDFYYRAEKFVKRNKISVAAAVIILLTLIGGIAATSYQYRVAAAERDHAVSAQARAEKINDFLKNMLRAASPDEMGKDVKMTEVLNDAAAKVENGFNDQPDLKIELLLTLSETYQNLGELNISKEKAEECLETSLTAFGENSKYTAYCEAHLAGIETIFGNYQKSKQMLQHSLNVQQNLSLIETKEYVLTQFYMGETLLRIPELNEAVSLLEEAYANSGKVMGADSAEARMIEMSLGRAREFSGDLNGAEKAYRNSVEFFRTKPSYKISLAMTLINLGRVLIAEEQFDEAEKVLLEAKEISSSSTNNSDYYQGLILSYLAQIRFSQDDYEAMVENSRQALKLLEPLLKKDAYDVVMTKIRLGTGLLKQGKAKESEEILREVADTAANSQIKKSSSIEPLIEFRLGQALLAQNKTMEAEPFIVNAVEKFNNSFGEKNAVTQESLRDAVTLYEKMHKSDVAAKYRERLIPSK